MKHSDFVIGNSSCGVRETPAIGVPSINIGTRQNRRSDAPSIIKCDYSRKELIKALNSINHLEKRESLIFGSGGSAEKFEQILLNKKTWQIGTQKYFVDLT